MMNRLKGVWISLDGTDGTGKSVLCNYLNKSIETSIVAPEFSESTIGKYLSETVKEKPHFISPSLIEQSLLFLADFFRIYDCVIRPSLDQGKTVLSDRGFISKYVYQKVVLTSSYKEHAVKQTLDSLFDLISPPDLTILLTCEEKVQIQRLMNRDGHCDENRIMFIRQANKEYQDFISSRNLQCIKIHQEAESLQDSLEQAGSKIKASIKELFGN